jgi:cardiolipin synthase
MTGSTRIRERGLRMGIIRRLSKNALYNLVWVVGLTITSQAASHAAPLGASSEVFYENASSTPIFQLIQSAKSSIDIEIYEIADTKVQAGILAAMDRGVKVRVVQESEAYATNCPVFDPIDPKDGADCKSQKNLIQNVRSKGGTYVPFSYQQFCADTGFHCLEHGKIVLIDRQHALISTGNFNATNLCDPSGTTNLTTCNRDYSIVSSDPNVVLTLTTIFENDLKGNAYDLPAILKSSSAVKLTVSPYSLDPIIQFIRSAKSSIQIENQYLKDSGMNAELIAAAKRGVKVYVVVSSSCAFGKLDPTKDAGAIGMWKGTFTAFDNSGIHSRIFTKQMKVGGYGGYLHAKAIVVDGNRAWVGSVNGSTQALTKNREFGIFVSDSTQVSKLARFLTADLTNQNSESWQESLLCTKD